MPRKYRRLPIRDSLDPLDQVELDNLGRWSGEGTFVKDKDPENVPLPFRELAVEELPPGFGFDEYGLLVLEKYAVTLPKSRETNAAELPGPEPVREVSPTDSNFEAGGPSPVDENISSTEPLVDIVHASSPGHSTELSST